MRALFLLGGLLLATTSAQLVVDCADGATCAWDLEDSSESVYLLQTGSRNAGKEKAVQGGRVEASVSEHRHAIEADASEHKSIAELKSSANASEHRHAAQLKISAPPQMTDALTAFKRVKYLGTKMGVWTGSKWPGGYDDTMPPYKEHFQSIVRLQGTKYVAIAGSAHRAGSIFIAEIASAPSATAAFGSSNLGSNDRPQVNEDAIVTVIDVPSPYPHAGGLGVWGSIIAVPVEEACSALAGLLDPTCPDQSEVHFYDVSNPLAPTKLDYKIERTGLNGGDASLVQEPDGTFLLVVGQQHSYKLDFYRTATTSLASDPGWTHVGTWDKDVGPLRGAPGLDTEYGRYQNVNFFWQTDGKLFMLGTTRDVPIVGDNWMDLFEVSISAPAAPFEVSFTKVASEALSCPGNTCDFYAGAGLYINSASEFFLYAVDWLPFSGVIQFDEFAAGTSTCHSETSGTCGFFGCSRSRGPTDCVSGKCYCKPGYCATPDGKCNAAR